MPIEATGAVRPTLFIGLGGTGKEILLRLRRRFYERWRVTGLPITGYLWVDTDPRDLLVSGDKLDEIDLELKFGEHEKISLLDGPIKKGLGEVLDGKKRFPHIHSWLPEEVKTFGQEIEHGAGAVRSIGRLTFFDRFAKHVKPAVTTTLQSILENPRIIVTREQYLRGAEFDSAPQVYMVFSVAGGTGGGTFLDMAFLLRLLGVGRITGIAMLPNVFAATPHDEAAARIYGNAYSALMELEHFSRLVSTVKAAGDESAVSAFHFDVDWTGHDRHPPIMGPPFSVLYLAESINEADRGAGSSSELFRAVADSLFLDFLPGQFSTRKRAHTSNVMQHMSRVDDDSVGVEETELRQSFSRRYATFGMSKIEIPVEGIREACGCRLSASILEQVGRPRRDPDLKGALQRDIRGRFDSEGLESLFGNDAQHAIERELRDACPERWPLTPGTSSAGLTKIVAELTTKFDEFDRNHLSGEGQDPKLWGTVPALIRNSTPAAIAKLRDRLREWIADCLDKPQLGLNALRGEAGLMALLIEHFRRIHKAPAPTESTTRQKKASDEAQAAKKRREAALTEMRLAAHSRFVHFLGTRGWTLETLYLRAREAADKHARSRAAAFLAEESAKLAKAGEDYLLEKASLLNQFGDDLSGHIAHFSELERNLVDFGRTYSTVRLYSEENFASFYLLGFDEHEKKHQPVNAAREHETFLDRELGPKKKTLDLIEKTKEKGGDWLRGRLRIFATDRFRKDFESCRQEPDKHRDCGRFVEVLKHARLNDGRKEKYEQFVYGALPMLRRSKRFPGSTGGEIRSVYLGVPATESDPYADFIQTVKDLLAAKGYTLKTTDLMLTDDPTCVYLYVESHAFPLPVAPLIVEECHETYYNFYDAIGQERKLRTSAIPLHASRVWEGEFEDLKPMVEGREGPAYQALEILSLGPLFGVVGLQTVDERTVFIYKDWRGAFSKDVRLGNRRQAREALTRNNQRDNRLRETLLKHLAAREASAMGVAAAAVSGPMALASASGTGVGVGVEAGWHYFWALVYLNLAMFPDGTPEYAIVQRRLTALGKYYRADLTGVGDDERKARCRTELNGHATWVGGYPVLNAFTPVHVGRDEELAP